jgi:pyridoxine 5-phosphate synthase
MAKLSVNVDHIATLRQARRTPFPDPVEAAWVAEEAGASGITVHLRMDRRHIQDSDVERLRESVKGKLNLEMSISAEMLKAAVRLRPHQVTLVPERPEEVTTEGGLNLIFYGRRIAEVAEQLAAHSISVSLFIDPDPRQLQALSSMPGGGARWTPAGSRESRSTPTPMSGPPIRRRSRRSWPRFARSSRSARRRGCRSTPGTACGPTTSAPSPPSTTWPS